jgi:hypothetical protein
MMVDKMSRLGDRNIDHQLMGNDGKGIDVRLEWGYN